MRFDVYRRANGRLALDLQADHLSIYDTRVVAPLIPKSEAPPQTARLNPTLQIQDEDYVLLTQYLAVARKFDLGTVIDNIERDQDQITRALDTLFTAF